MMWHATQQDSVAVFSTFAIVKGFTVLFAYSRLHFFGSDSAMLSLCSVQNEDTMNSTFANHSQQPAAHFVDADTPSVCSFVSYFTCLPTTAGCSGVVVDSRALCDENPGLNRTRYYMSGHKAAA
jgi:hypothetical protein